MTMLITEELVMACNFVQVWAQRCLQHFGAAFVSFAYSNYVLVHTGIGKHNRRNEVFMVDVQIEFVFDERHVLVEPQVAVATVANCKLLEQHHCSAVIERRLHLASLAKPLRLLAFVIVLSL